MLLQLAVQLPVALDALLNVAVQGRRPPVRGRGQLPQVRCTRTRLDMVQCFQQLGTVRCDRAPCHAALGKI